MNATNRHEEDDSRADESSKHQDDLVEDVRHRDVVVDRRDSFGVGQEVEDVRHRARNPTSPLIEELVEAFWRVSKRIGRGAVLDSILLLQNQSAQPSVLALIVLHIMTGLLGFRRVPGGTSFMWIIRTEITFAILLLHHAVLHQSFSPEQ